MGKMILNGKTYTGNSADGFPPLIYSDDEREVGVWRDGKPLYEKTIDIESLPNSGTKLVNHNIPNLEMAVSVTGFAYSTAAVMPLPNNHPNGSQYSVSISVTSTTINITTGMDRSAFHGYVTIQYTKTTDTPSSGRWATRSVVYHADWTATSVPGGSGYPLTDGMTLPAGQYLIILKSPYSTSGSSTQFVMALDFNETPAYDYGVCNPNTPSYAQFVTIITLTETTVVRGLAAGGYAVSWDSRYLIRGGIDAIRL